MDQPLTIEQYEKMDPVATFRRGARELHYATPNTMTLWRVQTILEKEPETIAWIDEFEDGDVLVDVGANVGMYTIWAAALRGARVYAFEPESQNYALLCKNVAINRLGGQVDAFCAALSDETGFGTLHLSSFAPGQSCHSFGEALDFNREVQAFPFRQGSFSTTLDALVADGTVPQPQHIKIDVDGIEHKVLAGAARAVADPGCRSILVEINRKVPAHRAIVDMLAENGFRHSEEEADTAMRTEGIFQGVGNYVFRR